MPVLAAFMVPHPPMIVPDIGRGSEEQIRETSLAYEQVADRIAGLRPETILITSPHSVMYADYFHISPGGSARGSFASFRAPQVRFREEYDTELVREICRIADGMGFPAGTAGEKNPELDGVDTVEQQVDIARQKGGIRKGERMTLQRFEVVRHQ